MRQAWAVAQMDARRLWFFVLAMGLLGGLVPSFASGLGARVQLEGVLIVTLVATGAIAGWVFGFDFTDGRGSFFFARPLPGAALLAGKASAVLGLGLLGTSGALASSWLSASDRPSWAVSLSVSTCFTALLVPWAMALYVGLAAATQARTDAMPRTFKDMALVFLRLTLGCAFVIFVFGLFADLVMRAFLSGDAARLFLYSWILAALVASFAGILSGRADRTRISFFQNRVMAGGALLIALGVCGAWAYVLHPDPSTIRAIYDVLPSPDGKRALVWARVDRGDPEKFAPTFVANLENGALSRLDADIYPAPRWSEDGASLLWSEATPIFFRPFTRRLEGASTFRIRRGDEAPSTLPVPADMLGDLTPGPGFLTNSVQDMIARANGEAFAFVSSNSVRFVTRSHPEGAKVTLPEGLRATGTGFVFTRSGRARTVALGPSDGLDTEVAVVDVDPETAAGEVVARARLRGVWARGAFEPSGERLLAATSSTNFRSSSYLLLTLEAGKAEARVSPLVTDQEGPQAGFLSDGSVAAVSGPRGAREFIVFGPDGEAKLRQPCDRSSFLGGELFPGVVALWGLSQAGRTVTLLQASTGRTLRQLSGFSPVLRSLTWFGGRTDWMPAPGTLGARLLLSQDRKTLYELPSPDASPRPVIGH